MLLLLVVLFLATANDGSAQESIRYWPDAVVPYSISPQFSANQRSVIRAAIDELHRRSCVRFVPRSNNRSLDHAGYLRVRTSTDGCWTSKTGFTGGKISINLRSPTCVERSLILHELMHVLGFLHEHNRPDRDRFLNVIWPNVEPRFRHVFVKRDLTNQHPIDRSTPYDYDSIMHYEDQAFSIDHFPRSVKRIRPTMIAVDNRRLYGGRTLSRIDVYRLNKLYECDRRSCQDYHSDCGVWQRQGRCSTDVEIMNVICRRSCQLCS